MIPIARLPITFTYGAARQINSIKHPDGSVTRYRYADSGRLEGVGNAAGEFVTTSYAGNPLSAVQSSPRNVPVLGADGRLAGTPGGAFVSTVRLDSLERPRALLGNNGQRLDIEYDLNGNVVAQTNATGEVTSTWYDAQGRPVRMDAPDKSSITIRYNGAGQVREVIDQRNLSTTDFMGLGMPRKLVDPEQCRNAACVSVMKRLVYTLIWLVISLFAGALGNYLFNVNFWVASLIAGLALIANGVIAECEDRRRDSRDT